MPLFGLAEVVSCSCKAGGLHVAQQQRWPSHQPRTRLCVQELPKELVESHYPTTEQLPDYFTNTAYIRFTPEVDCLALPGGRAHVAPGQSPQLGSYTQPGSWGIDCTSAACWLDPLLCVCAPHPPPPAGDVVRTEVRLVLCYRGWEYTILKRDTTHTDASPEQAIRLMVSSWAGVSGKV